MTWKNSKHGPCEFTQYDRLSLLVVVCLGKPENLQRVNTTNFTIALTEWIKQAQKNKSYNENGYEAG